MKHKKPSPSLLAPHKAMQQSSPPNNYSGFLHNARNDTNNVVALARMTVNENGNALIFILIAIALLGLLTVTLSRSGNNNDTGSFEQNQIAASEILTHAKSIENAVQSLLARGCSENEISFENSTVAGYINPNSPTDKSCHIFHVNGTGITVEIPTAVLSASYAVTDIETTNSDLLLILENQSDTLCRQINNITGAPVIDDAYGSIPVKFIGDYTSLASIGGSNETQRANSACFLKTSDSTYQFYHVLIAR
jgi:hypothetical protein